MIVPVKATDVAKSRLSGLGPDTRRRLALAFALDAVTAALSCPLIGRVVAVTNDRSAATELGRLGAAVEPDVPDNGLNPAILHGARVVRAADPSAPIAAMLADLPALRPAELSRAFALAGARQRWMVADLDGVGTTLLAAGAGAAFAPAFGGRSREAHRASGVLEVDGDEMDGLRRDVDTELHLQEAIRLGLGALSSAVVEELRIEPLADPDDRASRLMPRSSA